MKHPVVRLTAPFILCVLMVVAVGCSQQDVTKAAQVVKDSALALQAIQQTEIALHNGQLVDNEEHRQIQAAIGKAADALTVANKAVLSAKDGPTAKQAIGIASQAAGDLVTAMNVVKNPTAKASLQASLAGLQAILAAIGAS